MSEQTPNSSDGLNGSEPSMEDILASIRKIISDDEPVAMESPEDVAVPHTADAAAVGDLDQLVQDLQPETADLTSDAVLDMAQQADTGFAGAEGESVDLNVDDVLASLDGDILAPEAEPVAAVADEVAVDEDFSAALDDILAEDTAVELEDVIPAQVEDEFLSLSDDVSLTADDSVENLLPELVSETPDASASEDIDDIDALLNGLLGDDSSGDMDDLAEMDLDAEPASVGDTEDLDLVKSLMADLSDDTAAVETEEELDALLSIPEIEEVSAEAPVEDSTAAEDTTAEEVGTEDDILGEILDMTIEDEMQTHPDDLTDEDILAAADMDAAEPASLDDVVEAEQENIAENAQLDEDLTGEMFDDISEDDSEVVELPSLSEIAAAAEADAVAVETAAVPPAAAAALGVGALAGLAAVATNAAEDTPAEDETVTQAQTQAKTQQAQAAAEPAEIEIETTPESLPSEETEMPVKAVVTDTILDDVTEAATAGAFAELNQVVEDKAVFDERGPRIGDLVQDALRPMLKEWLDENLKGIVERAVTKEVKRISKGS